MATFTTIGGTIYQVQAVSDTLLELVRARVEKQYKERGEPIAVPTYEVKTGSGETILEEHDPTTLTTDDDRALWRRYVKAHNRMDAEQEKEKLKAKLLRGVIFEMPADSQWREMQTELGIEVPINPTELRYHYLTTEILITPEDLMRALQAIDTESYRGWMSEEEIASAINLFRHRLQRARILDGLGQKRALALPHETRHPAHSEGMGIDAQPVASAG